MSEMEIDELRNKIWQNSRGQCHRKDGPAIEYANGIKAWFIDGKRHREGGPAIEHPDGSAFWFIDGKRHREDGPAVERANGKKFWYFDGKQYLFEDWLGQLQISNEEKVMLCLKWK